MMIDEIYNSRIGAIIVEELHFQNKFAVKVDTNSGQIF